MKYKNINYAVINMTAVITHTHAGVVNLALNICVQKVIHKSHESIFTNAEHQTNADVWNVILF